MLRGKGTVKGRGGVLFLHCEERGRMSLSLRNEGNLIPRESGRTSYTGGEEEGGSIRILASWGGK